VLQVCFDKLQEINIERVDLMKKFSKIFASICFIAIFTFPSAAVAASSSLTRSNFTATQRTGEIRRTVNNQRARTDGQHTGAANTLRIRTVGRNDTAGWSIPGPTRDILPGRTASTPMLMGCTIGMRTYWRGEMWSTTNRPVSGRITVLRGG